MASRPLVVLTNVDHPRLPRFQFPSRFIDADFMDSGLGIVDQLEELGRVIHRLAGMRLPVSRLSPKCALRRATSCTVATVAADSAVHASAAGQLSPRLHGCSGGSSSFTARHPLSSPRSTRRPAIIAAPAPTSSQVVFLEFRVSVLIRTCPAFRLDAQERQAWCRSKSEWSG
jgi:hypothetical protein